MGRKLLEKMMKLGEERAGVADTLHQMEMDMLSLCNQAVEKRQSEKVLSWREKKAIECVGLGDYEGAKNILRDALEIRRSLALSNPERHQTDLAEVLRKEGRLEEALDIYNLLVQANQEAYRPEKARLSFEFAANLWDQGETERAEVLYGESFEIYSLLAGEDKDMWEPFLSAACDHIHRLKSALGKWEEAEIYCREALRVDRNLAVSNLGEYWRYQVESSEALGEILMRSPEKIGESKERYEEALELYEAHPDGEEQAQRIRGILEKYYGQER